MAETWPASIPEVVLRDGFSSQDDPQFEVQQMDVGPPTVRRRSTQAYGNVSASILLTQAQLATLKTFYSTTLSGGTKTFNFTDPETGVSAVFRFTEPYTVTPFGAQFKASMRWKREP